MKRYAYLLLMIAGYMSINAADFKNNASQEQNIKRIQQEALAARDHHYKVLASFKSSTNKGPYTVPTANPTFNSPYSSNKR